MRRKPFRDGDLVFTTAPLESELQSYPNGSRGTIFYNGGTRKWCSLHLDKGRGILEGVRKTQLRHATAPELAAWQAEEIASWSKHFANPLFTLEQLEDSLKTVTTDLRQLLAAEIELRKKNGSS